MRQYIGARYVPKFMGNYDVTQVYEALSVVDNGMGTSYISKIPTPAGTPLTDTTYWQVYGSSSGAIINLQNQIDTINNTIGSISGDITTLNTDVSALKRKAIYIGNSYAQGIGSTRGTDGIYKLSKDMFNDSKLYADGGVGFLTYTGHSRTFEDLLDDAIADTYFDSLDEVTDIIILSAWGDTLGIKNRGVTPAGTAMQTAMSSFVTKVKNNFTNVKRIALAFVDTRSLRVITGTSEGTSNYNEPFDAHWMLKVLAPRCGMEYLGWCSWETFMAGAQFTASDDYHPSDLGYTVISSNFKAAYNGSYQSAPRYIKRNEPFNITSGSTIALDGYISPDESVIELGRVNLAAGTTAAQYANFNLIDFSTTSQSSIVPPMPLNKSFNASNIDFLPDADFTHVLTMLNTIRANSEGSAEFYVTTFNASETLSNRPNAHCLENSYTIVHSI